MLCSILISAALAWTESGPERGHVVDAAVGPSTVSVATRVGVMTAPLGGGSWQRDPRFPPDVKVLAIGPDGVSWAAPPGQLWRVGETTERVASFDGGIVDLAVIDGAVLAAVRGSRGSVLRIEGGASAEVLSGVDPWRLLVADGAVWLGTADKGLWRSTDGGRSFKAVISKGSVSALGVVGGEVLVAFADGRVLDAASEDERLRLSGGWVSSIAEVSGGGLFTVDSPGGSYGPLCRFDGKQCADLPLGRIDADSGLERLTGVWTLPGGEALVGTFRRGPLRSDGATLRLDRQDFRATVTGGAAGNGEVLLAAMGTGAYLSADASAWTPLHGGDGPVTDAVSVSPVPGGYAVVDFEGVAIYRGGRWSRTPGVEVPGVPRRNGLEDVGIDAQGRMWSVDSRAQLRLREQGKWTDCAQRGGRLDGYGDSLVLATEQGFLKPGDCASPWTLAWPELNPQPPGSASRAEAGWLVGGGKVLHKGKVVAELKGRAMALATRADEALLLLDDGVVRRCTDRGCEPVDAPLAGAPVAVGWLADGRVWVAEAKGTVLVSGNNLPISPWSNTSLIIPPMDLARIYTPPWGREGQAGPPAPGGGPPKAAAAPTPAPARGCDSSGRAAFVLVGLGSLVRSRRR